MKKKPILIEAKLTQLARDTESQTPKLNQRASSVNSEYIGISKFGILNFRSGSQTNPGSIWYQTMEIPDISVLFDEGYEVTPNDVANILKTKDVKLMCDCLVKGTKVLMADGSYKEIQDIVEGDFVITHTGESQKVLGIMNRPAYDDLLEIDLGDRKIKCTMNHQFLVNLSGKLEWVYAKDLDDTMELLELGDL